MEKYRVLKQMLDELQEVLDGMQDITFLGQPIDAVDSMTFDTVIGMYLKISVQVDELKKLVESVLRCKNDSDRLNYLLENIYTKQGKLN